ncbi:MAG: dephospho-CoA kinase [Geodermatophilaceae bacterium]|jgi:dephospho-CoA kinase|nr:dephospho-CoA kinase [Geodermatophilaceae bacterium]
MIVGLTGGIGAGKSAVAARLAEHGALVVDADVVAREVVAPGTEGLAAVVAAFGSGVLADDGSLDRQRLGALIFADDEARARLNAIVHPLVSQRSAELAADAPHEAVVVHDVPLLVENALAPAYDVVVVVLADENARIQRLRDTRGMREEEARARMAAQTTDDQRRAVADAVLDNSGTLADLHRQVDDLWRDRLAPAAR